MNPKSSNSSENAYYRQSGIDGLADPIVGSYYSRDLIPFPAEKGANIPDKGEGNVTFEDKSGKKGRPSIFNRYSIFYFNSTTSNSGEPEPYMDMPNRLGSLVLAGATGARSVLEYPTAKNIISWASQGGVHGTNAIDYAWEDFLWCKNYGMVPNNYMITMRRFPIPVADDLTDFKKQPTPDIGRMISWVDGEANTWESVGLEFTTKMAWKEFVSEVQTLQAKGGFGDEGKAVGGPLGNIISQATKLTQAGSGAAARNSPNPGVDPYQNANQVVGEVDVIKKMMVRDKGLDFEQAFSLKFEYELKSIDGINPKVAMMDLLSNVLICTANRGAFWGGELRYTGGNPREIKPLGDPSKLQSGDLGGYLTSLMSNISSKLDTLTGGAGLSIDGITNAAKNLGGGLMDGIMGGALDKMGRPEAQAFNALLTGEDSGQWHVMIGNPANPIMTVGNLILEGTKISFSGALGPDDFPNKLVVTCTLKPARPRDRTDIMSMFHRNARMVLTVAPSSTKYAGNNLKPKMTQDTTRGDVKAVYNENDYFKQLEGLGFDLSARFPNHGKPGMDSVLDQSAQGIF